MAKLLITDIKLTQFYMNKYHRLVEPQMGHQMQAVKFDQYSSLFTFKYGHRTVLIFAQIKKYRTF